jgi:hypothetical protein
VSKHVTWLSLLLQLGLGIERPRDFRRYCGEATEATGSVSVITGAVSLSETEVGAPPPYKG